MTQSPLPLQASPKLSVPMLQDGGEPHVVPDGHSWQVPTPLHMPVVPQLLAACTLHSLCGSVLAAMAAQVPFDWPVCCCLHDMQAPLQTLLQQTPSIQCPLKHCVAPAQACPSGLSGWHAVPSQ